MTGSITTTITTNPRRPINRQCSDMSEASAVSFGAVHIREFDRIPGDHPDCKMGVPLTIDWAFSEQDPVDVDEYEEIKAEKQEPGEDGTFVTKLGSQDRLLLLQDFKVPLEEILTAEKDVQTFLKEREQRKAEEEAAEAAAAAKSKKPLKRLRKKVMSIFKSSSNKQQPQSTDTTMAGAA